MFDTLTDRLQSAVKNLRGESTISPENIEEAIREVRKSLLEADVSLKVVKLFISRVRIKALGAEVLDAVSPGQQFVKIVHEELVEILGGQNVPLDLAGSPALIMLLGLQGSGKTTACGKLAYRLRKDGHKPLMIACDVQRPAAIKQLQTLGKQIDIPVFAVPDSQDVLAIAQQGIEYAKQNNLNPVILDTAGRLQVDTELMAELLLLDRMFTPKEKLLVIDAMTGQEAVNVAEAFNTQIGTSGIILAKADGDARGGAALSVREACGQPIKFISTGEKLDNLDAFHPDRMSSRILGMGDVVALVEKAQEAIDEKEAEKVSQRMMQGEFTLEMFLQSQTMLKRMGSLGDLMKMLGVGGMLGLNSSQQNEIAEHGEAMMKLYETAINSMTLMERQKPEIINVSRRRRICRGSGLKDQQLVQMLKEFEQMRSMFQQFRKMMGNAPFPGMPNMPGMPGMPGFGMPDPASFKMPPNLPMGGKGARLPQGFPAKGYGPNAIRKKNKKRF